LKQVDFSIIVPVYNSADTLSDLCDQIHVSMQGYDYDIILVNDCSSDRSWQIIKQLQARPGSKITAINLGRNAGQHNALLCGFNFSKSRFIVTIDDDLQFLPADIPALIKVQQSTEADLVYGIQIDKKHSLIRNIGSKIVAFLFKNFASTPGRGSSFKLIKTTITEQIKHYQHSYTYLDELISWHSMNTQFVSVKHQERQNGKSGYNTFSLIRFTLRVILAYTTLPLKMMTYFGLFAFLICLAFVCFFIYQKLFFQTELGFTALIVSIFMSTGLILFCLGIIGEYLSRLFMLHNKKPVYLVKEVINDATAATSNY
jgi:glycosyltransferase involved in cell wall biosynthesis